MALEKWGGQEKLDEERAKRHEKRLEREKAKAGKSSCRPWASHIHQDELHCISDAEQGPESVFAAKLAALG